MLGCPYHPEETDGAVGMHHCPVCGEMVVAGMPHPDYAGLEVHLKAISSLRFGDLVRTMDGYYGLVVDPLVNEKSLTIDLFLGNGLNVTVEWTAVREVVTLPGSPAACNFQEYMVMSRP